MPTGPDDGFLEGAYQTMRKQAENMAPLFRPGYDSKELTGDDLEVLWNRRSMPVEQEWELHRAKNPDGTPMYSRELIGSMVFKERERLIRSGGRVEPKEWISFANQTAKRMAAKRDQRAHDNPMLPFRLPDQGTPSPPLAGREYRPSDDIAMTPAPEPSKETYDDGMA